MRWDGARRPTIWTVPPPALDPGDARLELARRYLHVFGPATAEAFAEWAGIAPARGRATFDALAGSLTPVRTPVGDAWILTEDEEAFRTSVGGDVASARLLPSGDTYFLLQGADRELLVPDPGRRRELWTPRVWPGAVLVEGEVAGTWRRAGAVVTIQTWRRLSRRPARRSSSRRSRSPCQMSRAGSAFDGRRDGCSQHLRLGPPDARTADTQPRTSRCSQRPARSAATTRAGGSGRAASCSAAKGRRPAQQRSRSTGETG